MADDVDLNEELDGIFGDEPAKETPAAEVAAPEPEGDAPAATTEPEKIVDEQTDSEPKAAATPKFDERTLAHAEAWGISRESAHGFQSKEALQEHLLDLHLRFAAKQQEQPASQESDKLAEAIAKMKSDPDGYDATIVAAMEELHARNLRQEKELARAHHAEQERMRQQEFQTVQQETDKWDRLFNEVDLPEQFGKGNYGALSPQYVENRSRVVQRAYNEADIIANRGGVVPPLRDLLEKAVSIEFGDAAKTKNQTELAKQLSKRESHISVRPRTQRSAQGKSEKEVFHEAFAKVMGGSANKEMTVEEMLGT